MEELPDHCYVHETHYCSNQHLYSRKDEDLNLFTCSFSATVAVVTLAILMFLFVRKIT